MGVHEEVEVAVGVGVVHRPALQTHVGDLLTGAVGLLDHRPRQDVLQFRSHEGPTLSRLHMLEVGDGPEGAVDVQDHSVTEVRSACHAASLLSLC